MKIEKINDNQIRCILTGADLSARKIKISELTYGSEKARNLFHDMMIKAKHECGFDAEGTPIMIEAIPMPDCLILNISKVTDPDELDTRFSSFSNPQPVSGHEPSITGADSILNLIKKAADAALKATKKAAADGKLPPAAGDSLSELFSRQDNAGTGAASPLIEGFRFSSLDEAICGAKAVSPSLCAENSLYKYDGGTYILILHSENEDPELFNRTCNILSEYSSSDRVSEGSELYLREHGCLMIAGNAIEKLASL